MLKVGVYVMNSLLIFMINVMLFIYAVLHTLDWQRALSNLTKTIVMIQIKQSSCKEKNTMLTDMKNIFMCTLALINAFLDMILSVDVSVIFSRLLISGDIESNPGPGRYPGELLRIFVCTMLINSSISKLIFNFSCKQTLTITVLMLIRY